MNLIYFFFVISGDLFLNMAVEFKFLEDVMEFCEKNGMLILFILIFEFIFC